MDDACDSLSAGKECEEDGILAATARLAKIAISAAEVSRRASDDPSTARHAMMAIDPLILALSNFQRSLSAECLQHCKIIIPSPLQPLKVCRAYYRAHPNRSGCYLRPRALEIAHR
jgi:hypothetical protein